MTVVFLHLATIWGPVFPMMSHWLLFQRFSLHTYLCVDFFFILSGFVISHAYPRIDDFDRFKAFMRARFARIYPLHCVVLLIFVALAGVGIRQDIANPPGSLLSNFLLIQALGMFPRPTWNTPAWSISVEFWTYPLFPLLLAVRFGKQGPARNLGLVTICIAGFATLSIVLGDAGATVGLAWVRCALGFSFGVALYGLYRSVRAPVLPAALTPLLFAMLLYVFAEVASPLADIASFILFGALLISAVLGKQSGVLADRRLVTLGDISYSIYLWHTLVLHAFAIGTRQLQRLTGSEAVTSNAAVFVGILVAFEVALIGWSAQSYRIVELPARRWLRGRRGAEIASRGKDSSLSSRTNEADVRQAARRSVGVDPN